MLPRRFVILSEFENSTRADLCSLRSHSFLHRQEAKRAMTALNDKLVRGRKIMVTAAAEQTYSDPSDVRLAALSGKGRGASRTGDAHRPTAISLLKGQGVANA